MTPEQILAGLERARRRTAEDFRYAIGMSRAPFQSRASQGWLDKAQEHQETLRAIDAARLLVEDSDVPLRVLRAVSRPLTRVVTRTSETFDRWADELLARWVMRGGGR